MDGRRIFRLLVLAAAFAVTDLVVDVYDCRSEALPPAFPLAVIEGPAGTIGSERIAIRKRFLGANAVEHFIVDLTLDELRTSGEELSIGAQTVALTDTTLLAEGQPTNSFAVVAVDWSTPPVEFLSDIRACLQLYRIRANGTVVLEGKLECRDLEQTEPF